MGVGEYQGGCTLKIGGARDVKNPTTLTAREMHYTRRLGCVPVSRVYRQ